MVIGWSRMTLALTIAFIVAMVALRFLITPVPGLLKMGVDRWGKRSMFMLAQSRSSEQCC